MRLINAILQNDCHGLTYLAHDYISRDMLMNDTSHKILNVRRL